MTTVIVCGGRDFADENRICRGLEYFVEQYGEIEKLVHGGATGADTLAGEWARREGVRCIAVPAAWKKHGKKAGPIRNAKMLEEHRPDYVIAFEGGKGTANMIALAEASGVKVVQL